MKFLTEVRDSDYDYVRAMYRTAGYEQFAQFIGQARACRTTPYMTCAFDPGCEVLDVGPNLQRPGPLSPRLIERYRVLLGA